MITPYHGKLENDMLNFEAELPFISVLTLIKKKIGLLKIMSSFCSYFWISSADYNTSKYKLHTVTMVTTHFYGNGNKQIFMSLFNYNCV
jgi:hypothetical protein